MNYYKLYGLNIRTTKSIPFLVEINATQKWDVLVEFKECKTNKEYPSSQPLTLVYKSFGLAPNEIPYLTIWKQYSENDKFLIIRYTDGVYTAFFVIDRSGSYAKVNYHPEIPVNDIVTYFLGPVIGCILRLKNKICLHASVVNINNKAIAFIGEKGAGKSTLLATFAYLGFPILSDDIAVLFEKNNKQFIHHGYKAMRLWKNTLENLNGIKIENLQAVLSNFEKYFLPLTEASSKKWIFQMDPLEISKVYYLQPIKGESVLGIHSCSPLEAFLKLKQNTYAEYMLEDELREKEFNYLGMLLKNAEVKLLNRPNGLNSLANTCNLIIEEN